MSVHEKPPASLPKDGRTGIKVVQIGNSLGVVLSKEILSRLKVERGDHLYLVETPDGFVITPYDPAVADQVEAGKRFMGKYRDTFRALAK